MPGDRERVTSGHDKQRTRIAPALFGPRRTLKISIYVYDKFISINVIVAARYSSPQRPKRWTCKRQAQGSIYSFSVDIEIFHESRTTAICNVNDTLSTS